MNTEYQQRKLTAERQIGELGIKSLSQMYSATIAFVVGGCTLLGWIGMKLLEVNDLWAEGPSLPHMP